MILLIGYLSDKDLQQIREQLAESRPEKFSLTDDQLWSADNVQLDTSFVCPCNKCTFESYVTKGCPMEGSGPYPYLDKSRLSECDVEDLVQKLSTQLTDVLKHFADLRTSTCKSLTSRQVNPDEVADSALSVKQFEPSWEKNLTEACERSVARVFMVLSRHMSFFNYEILEHIIKHHGTDEDQKSLSKYLNHFRNFCKRSVFQVPPHIFGHSQGVGEAKLSVYITDLAKYRDGTSDVSLASVKSIQRKFASILDVKASTLHVYEIEKGSIIIKFSIPTSIAKALFPLNSAQYSELESCGLAIKDTPINQVRP